VLTVRTEPTADASLAAIFDLIRFGIAIAAMIRMIATTIKLDKRKTFLLFRHDWNASLSAREQCTRAATRKTPIL
jgi:hypothetical protein